MITAHDIRCTFKHISSWRNFGPLFRTTSNFLAFLQEASRCIDTLYSNNSNNVIKQLSESQKYVAVSWSELKRLRCPLWYLRSTRLSSSGATVEAGYNFTTFPQLLHHSLTHPHFHPVFNGCSKPSAIYNSVDHIHVLLSLVLNTSYVSSLVLFPRYG